MDIGIEPQNLDIDIGDSVSPRVPQTAPHIITKFIHQGEEWPTHVVLVQTLIVPMVDMNTGTWRFVAEED